MVVCKRLELNKCTGINSCVLQMPLSVVEVCLLISKC